MRFRQLLPTISIAVASFSQSTLAQNHSFLSGGTGTSTGTAITTDTSHRAYVVGAYDPVTANGLSYQFGVPPSFTPSLPGGTEKEKGFIIKYDTESGVPNAIGYISINPVGTGCTTSMNSSYCIPKKTIIDPFGRVQVLGVFLGCNLSFSKDSSGVQVAGLSTSFSASMNSADQRVFLATFDTNLNAISCHVFYTTSGYPSFAGDVTFGMHPSNQPKVYLSGSFKGSGVLCESFGSALGAIAPFNNFPINLGNDYEIYVGQIDQSLNQLENIEIIGGPNADFCSDLASGYHSFDVGTDLFLAGTFSGSITFNHPSNGPMTFNAVDDQEIFSCRFPGFDISFQEPVIATGSNRDQALALSDDGRIVGGFISDETTFPGFGQVTGLGYVVPVDTTYPPYNGFRECGFFAFANYDTGLWDHVEILEEPNIHSQVNAISTARCDEFYVGWNRGMHPGHFLNFEGLGLPHANYHADHLQNQATGTSSDHFYISTLGKWETIGTTACSNIWTYDLTPSSINITIPWGGSGNIKAQYIQDIEVLEGPSYTQTKTDVLFTGRFGDSISLGASSYLPTGKTVYGGTTTPYLQQFSSMFLGGLDEHPNFSLDSLTVCIFDDTIDLNTWETLPAGMSFSWGDSTYFGEGVVDTINGRFLPSEAGVGTHTIYLLYSYFGCQQYAAPIYEITVIEHPFPRHPTTNGSEWAEGLAAEGAEYHELTTTDSVFNHNVYFLGGRYSDTIRFLKFDGSQTILTGPAGSGNNGFIAAYDACGVIWVNNIIGAGDDFVEALDFGVKVVSSESEELALYATGTIQDTLTLENSENETMPTSSINGLSFNSIGSGIQKGFVMEIEALTGKVNWLYLGGDDPNETNRFHDLASDEGYIGVVGEFDGNFTLPASGGTVSSLGSNYDPAMILLNTSGTVIGHGFSSGGFGTITGDDHGDAIDIFFMNDSLEIITTGYLDDGVGNSSFNYPFGTTYTIPTADEENIYLGLYRYYPTNGTLNHRILKIYDGSGSDYPLDVKFGDLMDNMLFGDYQIFFCGQFEDSLFINVNGSPTGLTTSGVTDFDAFVGCTDILLNDKWFTQEGRSIANTAEMAAAIDVDKSNAQLFIIGNQDGINNVSNYWNSSSSSSSSLLFGSGSFFRYNIFTAVTGPDGSLIDTNFVKPDAVGYAQGTDITILDTSVVTSGYFNISTSSIVRFYKSNGSTLHHSLHPNSNINDAYFARESAPNLSSFKTEYAEWKNDKKHELHKTLLFPNPNQGIFTISLLKEFSGDLKIYDFTGRLVHFQHIDNSETVMVRLGCLPGAYLYTLNDHSKSLNGYFIMQ